MSDHLSQQDKKDALFEILSDVWAWYDTLPPERQFLFRAWRTTGSPLFGRLLLADYLPEQRQDSVYVASVVGGVNGIVFGCPFAIKV